MVELFPLCEEGIPKDWTILSVQGAGVDQVSVTPRVSDLWAKWIQHLMWQSNQ